MSEDRNAFLKAVNEARLGWEYSRKWAQIEFVDGAEGAHRFEPFYAENFWTLPSDWNVIVAAIGDGSGVVGGQVIIAAECVLSDAPSSRAFWFARLARRGRGRHAIVLEDMVVGCWPHGVATLHKNLNAAMRAAPPPLLREREAAYLADRRLSDEDLAALEGLEF